jgi:hypothetical protein
MLAPLAQLWLLVAFAIVGVVAGVAQMLEHRACPCCGAEVGRGVSRCPHCLCRLD